MPKKSRVRGAISFEKFLTDRSISQREAARQLHVTGVAVHMWLSGDRRPLPFLRDRIAKWTSGHVAADSWMTAAERRRVEREVTPFAATGTEG